MSGDAAKVMVTTQHNDNFRSGANLQETTLAPDSLRSGRFGKLFSRDVDGQIYAQPLYVPNVRHSDERMHPTVYVATMRNWVYAFDAENPGAQDALWSVKLADSVDHDFFPMVFWFSGRYNIDPDIGITSTPVIDLETNTMYVVAKVKTAPFFFHWFEKVTYRLYALDIGTGEQRSGSPVEITAKLPGFGRGSKNGFVAFDPVRQLQRPAILLVKTPTLKRIYLGFGSHQDTNPFHGWVLAYDAKTLQQTAAYCTSCKNLHSSEAGVWQAGSGPAADDAGNIYLITGNVPPSTKSAEELGNSELGNSIIKLSPDLDVLDWFTPANYACLNETDGDLGSSGPMLIKNTNLMIGGGKEGVLYLVSRDGLGKVQKASMENDRKPCDNHLRPAKLDAPLQSFQASLPWEDPHSFFEFFSRQILAWGFHHIHGAPVYFADAHGPIIYIWPERDFLRGYRMQLSDHRFANVAEPGDPPQSTYVGEIRAGQGMPGAALAVSANGNDPRTALIWASLPAHDDALTAIVDGVLRVFEGVPGDAGSQLLEIWNSDQRPDDSVGKFAKYVAPTVANGRVYLASFSGGLHVFGLKDTSAAPAVASAKAKPPQPASPAEDGAHRMGGMMEMAESPSGASFVEQVPPPQTMRPGQRARVSVTIRNTGGDAWSSKDHIFLVAQHPARNRTWTREGEVRLPSEVLSGSPVTIAFDITAPREGRFHFQWQLARDGHFFGERSTDVVVDVDNPECDAIRKRRGELLSHPQSRNQVQLDALTPDAAKELKAIADQMTALDERAEQSGCALPGDHTHKSAGSSW